jgi:hypothetical protein
MAANTPTLRLSAMNLGSPWRGVGTLPGAYPAVARPAAMYLYGGLAVMPLPPQEYVFLFRAPVRPGVLAARSRPLAFAAPDRQPLFVADPRNRRQ